MITKSYSLGIFFIFLVAVIWAAASVLVQYLYDEQSFDSPFLLTYIGTSLMSVLVPADALYESYKAFLMRLRGGGCSAEGVLYASLAVNERTTTTNTPPANEESVDNDDAPSVVEVTEDEPERSTGSPKWDHAKHRQIALRIAPIWFISNWCYNASLDFTSITSSTVLVSTGSLFTFLFAVLARDEKFACLSLLGVLFGVLGSCLTTFGDAHNYSNDDFDNNNNNNNNNNNLLDDTIMTRNLQSSMLSSLTLSVSSHDHHRMLLQDGFEDAVWGDIMGLLSAVGYGLYAVMIRTMCPRDEKLMSMGLLMGYIGFFNASFLSPIAATLLFLQADGMSWTILGFLVVKGLFDNVLSDYLWGRAVVLTNATVATVGLGLTIPLAFLSDYFTGHATALTINSYFGALSVALGFVMVNVQATTATATTQTSDEDLSQIEERSTEMQVAPNNNITPTRRDASARDPPFSDTSVI